MTEELTGRDILKQALAQLYDEEGAALEREAANTPRPKLSEAFIDRMEALIRSTEERERPEQLQPLQTTSPAAMVHPQAEELQPHHKTGWRRSKRAVRRLIIAAVLLAVLVPAGVFGAYRAYVNYQMTLQEDGRGYDVIFEKDENGLTLEEFTPFIPTTPEGFEVIDSMYDSLAAQQTVTYQRQDDDREKILYSQRYITDESGMTINAEVDEEWHQEINGIDVYCTRESTVAGDLWGLFWVVNNQIFEVYGNTEYAIVEGIAENICMAD